MCVAYVVKGYTSSLFSTLGKSMRGVKMSLPDGIWIVYGVALSKVIISRFESNRVSSFNNRVSACRSFK